MIFIGICGASGSGKTTLLNCISTIDRVTSGHIFLENTDITTIKGKELNRWFICYHEDDPSQIEIWVGDGKSNEPKYRMYPDRDSRYV